MMIYVRCKLLSVHMTRCRAWQMCLFLGLLWFSQPAMIAKVRATDEVEAQPFVAQIKRLIEALDYLGEPLEANDKRAIEKIIGADDRSRVVAELQSVLDRRVLFDVDISPESRVKVRRGAAQAILMEQGWRIFLVKVRNQAGVTAQLKAASPNALPVYARSKEFVGPPRASQTLTASEVANRWLDLMMYDKQPLEPQLSGLPLEYRIVQLYSRDRGRREAQTGFNVGQGSQDIGYRNDVSVLFTCRASKDVTLRILDEDERPTTASLIIKDGQNRIYPTKIKRLAPDFAFQPQIYREDGEQIRLPSGAYDVEVSRGPEYIAQRQTLSVRADASTRQEWTFRLKRWIDPARMNWYSGDHHIHAAGCSHYEAPTQGVLPKDMIRHIKGEALNVGDVLTWGPCYYFQKQFFEAKLNALSTPDHLMRYDVEVSGFPSSHAGHLTLLDLREQDYPQAQTIDDWPSWDLPILQWAKSQTAVVGFAHSGWGLEVKTTDLPNYEMPRFDGIGANEYIVDVTHDAVDFISTVDTPPTWELNIWYHTLNTGFRTRIGGETDFPCIYGERVGMGRSYVQLDGKLDYDAWVRGIRDGRAYVSDGKSHLMDFRVNDLLVGTNGSELRLDKPQNVRVTANVAARLGETPDDALRARRNDEQPFWDIERARIKGTRAVPLEVIVNARVVATKTIIADGALRPVSFEVPIAHSSWVALRILPSSHTNPIFIIVGGRPIRASRRSAEWCLRAVDQCWSQKAPKISAKERPTAEKAYEHARQIYRQALAESDRD